MPADSPARLERVLAHRRSEEELAQRRAARALQAVASAHERLRRLTEELAACRECGQPGVRAVGCLIDAHHCADRLRRSADRQRHELESARAELAGAREAVAEAGRRRLAVERLVDARTLCARDREQRSAQTDLDESSRLRVLLEGD
ncbi:MAG: flagellar export protein FliJ [Armatimonadota bacterium]|jgi:flagellar export protein FliJ